MTEPGVLARLSLRQLAERYAYTRDLDALDELDRREEEAQRLMAENKRLQELNNHLADWIAAQTEPKPRWMICPICGDEIAYGSPHEHKGDTDG